MYRRAVTRWAVLAVMEQYQQHNLTFKGFYYIQQSEEGLVSIGGLWRRKLQGLMSLHTANIHTQTKGRLPSLRASNERLCHSHGSLTWLWQYQTMNITQEFLCPLQDPVASAVQTKIPIHTKIKGEKMDTSGFDGNWSCHPFLTSMKWNKMWKADNFPIQKGEEDVPHTSYCPAVTPTRELRRK